MPKFWGMCVVVGGWQGLNFPKPSMDNYDLTLNKSNHSFPWHMPDYAVPNALITMLLIMTENWEPVT